MFRKTPPGVTDSAATLDHEKGRRLGLLFADEAHFLMTWLVVPFVALIRPNVDAVLLTIHIVWLALVPKCELHHFII